MDVQSSGTIGLLGVFSLCVEIALVHSVVESSNSEYSQLLKSLLTSKFMAPTGHAVVMLQPGGENTIINFEGANVEWPKLEDGISRLTTNTQELIKRAGAVLLQREIPDAVNLEAAKIAKSADVLVIMEIGGAEGPIPEELLKCVTVLRSNATELGQLTAMSTSSLEEILLAAAKVQEMGVKQVLVKIGEYGSVLVRDKELPVYQPAILAPVVVDTAGTGKKNMSS